MLPFLKRMAPIGLAGLLAGCLYTARPVFDETNSVPIRSSAEFAEYARVHAAFEGEEIDLSELGEEDVRVVERDDFVILEMRDEDAEEAMYMALGHAGGRPFTCIVDLAEDIEGAADAAGLHVAWRYRPATGEHLPADPVPEVHSYPVFDGTDAALHAFVIERFDRGPLDCKFPPPENRTSTGSATVE